MDCCDIYADQFDRDSAVSQAQRYRERGLRSTSRLLHEAIADRGLVRGATVLEIGGGAAGLSIELLKAGARSAISVELSSSYRDAAVALALEAGFEDRLHLIAGDGAEVVSTMGRFDIVVMNRVVCCYPDGGRLMRVGADAAGRVLAVSYPSVHPLSRAVVAADNWRRARLGAEFRTFLHPVATLISPIPSDFAEVFRRRRPLWSVHVWERDTPP